MSNENNTAPESTTLTAVETDDAPESADPRCLALAKHFGVEVEEISECSHGDNTFECDSEPGEYLVVTDEEADALWDASLDSYIDDCMKIPKEIEPYFDRDKWKRDAKIDGRGHSLSSYDGNESDEKIDDVRYYIYRTN